MPTNYITFQSFSHVELAKEIAAQLKQQGIDCILQDEKPFFDPTFANNQFEATLHLKLKPKDFKRANEVLESYYDEHIEKVDRTYYLYDFTDQELIEVISKSDEWGHFDYRLAHKILKDRGLEISNDIALLLKQQRINELAKPRTSRKQWIYIGYAASIFGGILGLIIGYSFAYQKKTLPDGQRVFAYDKYERSHGAKMIVIALIVLLAIVMLRLWQLDKAAQ